VPFNIVGVLALIVVVVNVVAVDIDIVVGEVEVELWVEVPDVVVILEVGSETNGGVTLDCVCDEVEVVVVVVVPVDDETEELSVCGRPLSYVTCHSSQQSCAMRCCPVQRVCWSWAHA
jgi:hypothetical protein